MKMQRRHYTIWLFIWCLISLWMCPVVYADDIDVMIVFDNTAKTWVDSEGGGMNVFAAAAVAKMNLATTNSNVDLTFYLAHAAHVDYTHSGNLQTDLYALQAGSGNLSDVHDWRNTYGADLVAMLVDTGSATGYTGIGYMLTTMSGMAAYAFSVSSIRAVDISHTMTHEVGHNLGAHHSKDQADDPGPNTYLNTYSAGWYFTGTNSVDYHTIMAYNDDGYGNFYYSAPLFSTPLVTYQGTAAGDASDGDNARTIRATMGVVSGYRAGTAQVGTPASITVPTSSTTGNYTVSWGASSTSGVTYVLEEATNSSFTSGLRQAYSGSSTSASITGRTTGTTYYYRVKATKSGYTDSAWRTGSNGCVVTITPTAGRPSSITVPSSDSDGSYIVSWGSSSTSSVTYVLQEATNSSFSSGLRTAYSGASTSTTITGRSCGTTYYYRVKATKTGYTDSSWRTGSNGCVVTSLPLPVTENFSSSSLPTDWTTQNTGTGITERWSVSNSTNAGGSAYEMKCHWQSVNPGTTRLITPWIKTLGMDQITLSFRHFLDAYGTGANLRVQTSNNKSTWTNTPWSVATSSSNIGPATVTVAITTNLNSSTTYIAFVVDGDLYRIDDWYIDNVSIRSTILHVSKDGNCGGKKPCYTTIQAAVNAAKDGDTIKVNQGTFNEAPVRSTTGTVIIKGGWNSTFTSQTGTTEMHAPGATGGGGVKLQPNIGVVPP